MAVVVAEHENIDTQVLLNHCRNALPAYMLPQQIHVVASLPLNPNGKVDRPRLRDEIAVLSEAGTCEVGTSEAKLRDAENT